jgi:hypothetical protein
MPQPALRRLRQQDCEFKASLDYTVRSCLKKKERKEKENGARCYEFYKSKKDYKRILWPGAGSSYL